MFYLYYIYFNRINNHDIFLIKKYSDSYYSIPEDKKGKNIPNTNIKILDYKYNQTITHITLHKITKKIINYKFYKNKHPIYYIHPPTNLLTYN